MSGEHRAKLESHITSSTLSGQEQREFIDAIAKVDDAWLGPLVQLMDAYPEVVPSLFKNLKAKQAAAEHGDDAAWEKVMADEETWLERFAAATEEK